MSAHIDLYWLIPKGYFVQSPLVPTRIVLPAFHRQDRRAVRLHLLDVDADTRGTIVQRDLATYECVIGIGDPADASAFAENNDSMVWDAGLTAFVGVLDLYTDELEAELAAAAGQLGIDATFYFRVQAGAAATDDRESGLAGCRVLQVIKTATSGLPASVTASQFADLLEDAVVTTPAFGFERTGNTFTPLPAVYRDFTLADVLRVENPRASGLHPSFVVATSAEVEDTAAVVGMSGRRGMMRLRVRGCCSLFNPTGGTEMLVQTGISINLGGTVPANSVVAELEVSSPAQTIFLNASTGTATATPFDYLLDVAVDPGATLTLRHRVTSGDLYYGGNSFQNGTAVVVVPGIAPYPAGYDGEFLVVEQVPLAGVEPTTYQSASVIAAGTTDIADGPLVPDSPTWPGDELLICEPGAVSRVHTVVVAVGAGAYTHKLLLLTTNRASGDVVKLRLQMPASAGQSIEVRNATSGGTVLTTIAGTAAGTDFAIEAFFNGTAWTLRSVAPDATTLVTAPQLYTENPSTPAASTVGVNSAAVGQGNTLSAGSSALGDTNTVAGTGGRVVGSGNNLQGADVLALARSGVADGNAVAAVLIGSEARAQYGMQEALGFGVFSNAGDRQASRIFLSAVTTDATQTELLQSGLTPRIQLPALSCWKARIEVLAFRYDTLGEADSWTFETLWFKGATNADIVMLASNQLWRALSSAGAELTAWQLAIDADTTNGSARVRGTTGESKTVRWFAVFHTLEQFKV